MNETKEGQETAHSYASTTTAEEFYGKTDSCYIRVIYNEEADGYKFEVRNENYYSAGHPDLISDGSRVLSALVRGMIEFAIMYPPQIYNMGIKAQSTDIVREALKDMPKEHREAFTSEVKGNA